VNEYYDEEDSRVCLGDDASASVRFGGAFSHGKLREELDVQLLDLYSNVAKSKEWSVTWRSAGLVDEVGFDGHDGR
jgi:hypothetical protein